MYKGFVHLPQDTSPFGRYLVYSIDTQTTRELADFPLYVDSTTALFDLSPMNWTEGAKSIVGTLQGDGLIALVIVHNDDDEMIIETPFQSKDVSMEPKWSPHLAA
ncbi:MAG: hypothetical protein R3E31_22270 [Chloroflexota bacterium]